MDSVKQLLRHFNIVMFVIYLLFEAPLYTWVGLVGRFMPGKRQERSSRLPEAGRTADFDVFPD